MQRQREQIVRKARKLLSRDRSSQLHKINRVTEKQPEDKRVGSPTMIPQQKIIKGLRSQLTNLKEQVAKLTFRQQKKSLEAKQINMQYKGYCDQQNKEYYNVQYSKNGKFYRREKKKSERARSEDSSGEETILIKQPYKKQAKIQEIIKQFKQFKVQNQHLMHQNQKLRNNIFRIEEKLRYSQDGKQKFQDNQLMIENNKIRCQNLQSHSFVFQKQNEEQRILIQQLKQTLQISTQSNMLLKQEIQLLRENSITLESLKTELNARTNQLELLRLKLQEQTVKTNQKQQTIEDLRLKLQNEKNLVAKLTQERDRQAYINNENKLKIAEMKNKIIQLQKSPPSNQHKPKESKRKPKQHSQEITQLQQIIRMQEKSMNNYESDLSYLQKQLKKHHQFKLMYEKMAAMLDQANQQCIRLNLCLTVSKYKPF